MFNAIIALFVLMCLYPYFSRGVDMFVSDLRYVFQTVIAAIVQTVCQIIIYIRVRHDRQ